MTNKSLRLRGTINRMDKKDIPAIYIFGEKSGNGYVITSADDRFPAILGYSDSYSDSIPPAMRWWLNSYAENISRTLDTESEATVCSRYSAPEKREPIAPLLKTKWNQGEPYNLYSPEVEINGTKEKCPTGCVATSMAQLMKYHNWPPKGKGFSSYDWTDRNGNRHTFATDFSEFVFNWDEMLDSYETQTNEDSSTTPLYTDAQAEAVAKLMHACGMAEKMNFDPWGSGAQTADIPHSLTEYFDYSNDVRFKMRAFTTTPDWETTIYESLRDYGPVIYNGRDDWGGHSFVCDGYDGNGYYHFNWGWGGMSDGYFLFFGLNPSNQGIGSFEGGYNLDQNIIYNIRPPKNGESSVKQQIVIQAGGDLTGESPSAIFGTCSFTTSNATGNLWSGFANNSSETINGNFAIKVIDNERNETIVRGSDITSLQPGSYYSNFHVENKGFAMGEYTVYAGMILKDTEEFIPFEYPVGCRDHVKMLIGKDGYVMVSNDIDITETEIVVSHTDLPHSIERGEVCEFSFYVANLNENIDFNNYIRGIIKDDKGNDIYSFRSLSFVPGGYSVKFPMNMSLPFPKGGYALVFESMNGKKISRTFGFTLTDSFTDSSSSEIRVSNISYLSGHEPMLTLKVSYIVPGPTEDYYDYYVKIFDGDMKYLEEYTLHPDTRFDWVVPNTIYTCGYEMIHSVSDVYNVQAYKRIRYTADRTPASGPEVEISKMFRIDLKAVSASPIEEVRLNDVPETLKINMTYRIGAVIHPSESADNRLYWTSTDENVFTVDDNGLVKATGEGSAKIVVSSENGKFDYREITVRGNEASISDNITHNEGTVEAVYNINGIKVLDRPLWDEIYALPRGIYIVMTEKGVRKLVI